MSDVADADEPVPADGEERASPSPRLRWVGVVAVVGSVLFVVSLGLQEVVPQPDSYQFDPALTSPQFLRDVVAPGMTVAGLAGHLVTLVALRVRDDSGDYGDLGEWQRRFLAAGWWGTSLGVAMTLVGYGGLFTFGQGTGIGAALFGLLFALFALVGIGALGIGTGVWGATILRVGETRRSRVLGALLLAVPVVGVGISLLPVEVVSKVASVPYAAAVAALGVDLWIRPTRPTLADSSQDRS